MLGLKVSDAHPHSLVALHNRPRSGWGGAGEGWAGGPSRRDAKRPSGNPSQPASSTGCGAASSPPSRSGGRGANHPRHESTASPQIVRNSANLSRYLPVASNGELAGQQPCSSSSMNAPTPANCARRTGRLVRRPSPELHAGVQRGSAFVSCSSRPSTTSTAAGVRSSESGHGLL